MKTKSIVLYTNLVVAVTLIGMSSGCTLASPTRPTESATSASSESLRLQDLLEQIPGVASANPIFVQTALSRRVALTLEVNTVDVERLKGAQRYGSALLCSNKANPNPGTVYETIRWSKALGPNAFNQGPKSLLSAYISSTPGLSVEFPSDISIVSIAVDCKEFLDGSTDTGREPSDVPADLLTPVPTITAVPSTKP